MIWIISSRGFEPFDPCCSRGVDPGFEPACSGGGFEPAFGRGFEPGVVVEGSNPDSIPGSNPVVLGAYCELKAKYWGAYWELKGELTELKAKYWGLTGS